MSDTVYRKAISSKTYDALYELGKTESEIKEISKKRLLIVALLIGVVSPLMLLNTTNMLIRLSPLILSLLLWIAIDRSYELELRNARRDKHFEFLYFAKLIVPYLKSSGSSNSLYMVFRKMSSRMEDGLFKNKLNNLMIEMSSEPGTPDPLIKFASSTSNTDLAEDFMVALFDWQQTTEDTAVISRMEKKITEALMMRIDEVIKIKTKRFDYYVARIFYSVFLLILGVLGVVMVSQIAPLMQML